MPLIEGVIELLLFYLVITLRLYSKFERNLLSPSMGDSTTTRTKQINSQIQEVTIERTKTLTYGIEDNSLRAEEFLAYITTLRLQHHIACVQEIYRGDPYHARGDVPDAL